MDCKYVHDYINENKGTFTQTIKLITEINWLYKYTKYNDILNVIRVNWIKQYRDNKYDDTPHNETYDFEGQLSIMAKQQAIADWLKKDISVKREQMPPKHLKIKVD